MKILLDECITKRFKTYLQEYKVFTVIEMSWSGIKNGKLMALCVENNFDVLLTIDKNIAYQQNLQNLPLTIVILDCSTSKVEELIQFLPSFKNEIDSFEKFKSYLIHK